MTYSNLKELFDAIVDGRQEIHDSLPTFGGTDPVSTVGVWSWDMDQMIVSDRAGGTNGSTVVLVDRGAP